MEIELSFIAGMGVCKATHILLDLFDELLQLLFVRKALLRLFSGGWYFAL